MSTASRTRLIPQAAQETRMRDNFIPARPSRNQKDLQPRSSISLDLHAALAVVDNEMSRIEDIRSHREQESRLCGKTDELNDR